MVNNIRFVTLFLIALLGLFSQAAFSQNNDEGLDQVCSLSGGKWHTSASGWACCWSNWGCYGCTNGDCVMACRTKKCKNANSTRALSENEFELNEIAPKGTKAPIVPKRKNKQWLKKAG